ncbi:hypothetical protein BDR05DRAFT_969327 [Suillus weaverae]|nr:hypothetical protein BDR05DRAFT_969327 [Suillus weaverae]
MLINLSITQLLKRSHNRVGCAYRSHMILYVQRDNDEGAVGLATPTRPPGSRCRRQLRDPGYSIVQPPLALISIFALATLLLDLGEGILHSMRSSLRNVLRISHCKQISNYSVPCNAVNLQPTWP